MSEPPPPQPLPADAAGARSPSIEAWVPTKMFVPDTLAHESVVMTTSIAVADRQSTSHVPSAHAPRTHARRASERRARILEV
jgi:hypothetical protein